jgi:hypothetical protein
MKAMLTLLLSFCLALGMAGGLVGPGSQARSCPGKSGECPPHSSHGRDGGPSCPCAASCPICGNAGLASLAQSEALRVSWVSKPRPADAGWLAEAVTYPPPLPPPRLAPC